MEMELDKKAHVLAGIAAVALLWPVSPVAAGVGCVLIAVGKEIYDARHRATHTPDVWDAVATGAGGAVAALWLAVLPVLKGVA